MKLSRHGTGTAGNTLVQGRTAERAVARGTAVAMAAIVLLASNHDASAQTRTPIVGTGAVFNPGTQQVVVPPFIDRPVKIEGWSGSPTSETLLALGADGGVSASNSRGYRFLPASSLRAIDIADGGTFGVVLREGGTVQVWPYVNASPPAGVFNVPADVGLGVQVEVGGGNVFVRRTDGTITGWPGNAGGVMNGITSVQNATGFAMGGHYFGTAVRADGTVICWGNNDFGQCNIPPGLAGVTSVAAYRTGASIALKSDGSLVCWGDPNDATYFSPPQAPATRVLTSIAGQAFAVLSSGQTVCLLPAADIQGSPLEQAAATVSNPIGLVTGSAGLAMLQSDGRILYFGYSGMEEYSWAVPAQFYGAPTFIQNGLFLDPATGTFGSTSGGGEVFLKGKSCLGFRASDRFVSATYGSSKIAAVVRADGTVADVSSTCNSTSNPQIPAGINNAVQVAGGSNHLLIRLSTGAVVGAPNSTGNGFGQATTPPGLPPSVAINAVGNLSGSLSALGALSVWGDQEGALTSPPQGTFQAFDLGGLGAAVRSDGTLKLWGTWAEGYEQNGGVIPNGPFAKVSVASSGVFGIALRTDGTFATFGFPTQNSGALSLPTDKRYSVIECGDSFTYGIVASNDCNSNGINDSTEIAGNLALDCNGNGKLDSCEASDTAGAVRDWIATGGGNFANCANWNLVPPSTTEPARFAIPSTYTVSFTANRTTRSAAVTNGNVGFSLGTRTYTLTSTNPVDSKLSVSGMALPTLTVLSGTVTAPYATVGELAGNTGTLNIGSGGRLIATTDLCVGCAGAGTMNITSGGRVTTSEATVGASIGSSGTVSLSGSLSKWIGNLGIDVRRGTLSIASPASVDVPNVPLVVFQGGTVRGTGTVNGDIANFGDGSDGICGLEPGAGTAGNLIGTFNLLGNYGQIPADPKLGNNSGSLGIDVVGGAGGALADLLAVQGQASLGGGLFVRIPQGDPGNFTDLPILTAALLDPARPAFDVAYLPALPDGRFIRVNTVGALAGAVISLSTDTLAGLLGFGGANSAFVAGQPLAAASGDFDADGDTDIAVTVGGSTPTSNGALLVLFNDGTGGLSGVLQIPLGVDPVAIAAGRLRDNGPIDLVVANRGSDNIQLLFNNGTGVFSTGSVVSTGAGSQPNSVALAPIFASFVGQSLDIGVTLGGLNSITVLRNNNGTPIQAQTAPTGPRPGSVGGDDVDNDRDIDFVVANTGNGTATVFRNTTGTFAETGTVSLGVGVRSLAMADLNNDGYADFVTVNEGDATTASSVSVVINRTAAAAPGTVEFAPSVNVPAGGLPTSPAVGDFDADGDLDVAYAGTRPPSAGGNRVVMVLRNDGTSGGVLQLSPGDDVSTTQSPNIVLAAQMNSDTVTDIVALGQAAAFSSAVPTYTANVLPSSAGAGNCPADLTGDGLVDGADLGTLLSVWGPGTTGDLTGDGLIDGADLGTLLSVWGPCGNQ